MSQILFFALSFCFVTTNALSYKIGGEDIMNLVSNRFKRSIQDSIDDVLCVTQKCLMDGFYQNIEKTVQFDLLGGVMAMNLTSSTDKESVKMQDLFNPELFDNFCGEFRKARVCIDRCPDTLLKSIIVQGHEPFENMCVEQYDEMKKHLHCYETQYDNVDKHCRRACNKKGKSQNGAVFEPGSQCTKAACNIDCFLPKMASKCNRDAAKVFDKFNKNSMASIVRMIERFSPTPPPQACAKFLP